MIKNVSGATSHKDLPLEISLTWRHSRKMGQLNENVACVLLLLLFLLLSLVAKAVFTAYSVCMKSGICSLKD